MKKTHRVRRTLGIILIAIFIFMVIINLIPPKKNVENNPFLIGEGELPLIAAHRGGMHENPANTMLAFREAVNTIEVDIIESDLYVTKDGYLVYNHDAYIDETCNINGDISLEEVEILCETEENRHYIQDMTLSELEQYNFGYYFEDENGERIYKNVTDLESEGLQIATVDKLFKEFYETNPDLLFIVEIKNGGDLGYEACQILSDTLNQFPEYRNQVVVGTFHAEIEEELNKKYPDLLRGASTSSATSFVLSQFFGVNLFYESDFACLQMPMSYEYCNIDIKLDKKMLIERAHKRNVAVQYWTINDEDEMRRLIELGCDCIMTDNPKLLKSILEEYK